MNHKKDNHFDCKDKTGGYSLIEVLIAMAIFSVGILAVGNMQLRSTGGNTNARISTEASVWAQDRVETLMLLPYTHVDLNPGTHNPQANDPIINSGYNAVWRVFDSSGATPAGYPLYGVTPAANTKIILVSVTGPKGTFRTNPAMIKFTRGVNY